MRLGLFDEREHVAHAEDALREPVGVEGLERVRLLADAHESDRPARHFPHRQGRAAAGVTVQLGQHHRVDAHRGVELLRDRQRVLAGHGVHHEQHVVRRHLLLDHPELVQHLLVDVQPPCRVEDERREAALGRLVARRAADGCGLLRLLAQHGYPELLAQAAELLDRGRAVDVGRGHDRMLPLLLEVPRELGRRRRLARALEAHQHDDRGRMRRHCQAMTRAAEQLDQLVANDLDDLLARRERGEHVLADGFDADALDEALDDLEIDVGFEKSHAHFAQGLLDILLRQPAVATEPVKYS